MDLQKFGVKLFINANESYNSKEFIPVFHNWIQDKIIDDHLLIDVADYSHIPDGPGVMLISHEGNFSLDQENQQPGIMYMRKTEIAGSFKERFNTVLSTVIKAANLVSDININKQVDFKPNLFRFITNDRLYAENTANNQDLYKEKIQNVLDGKYPDHQFEFEDVSDENERLAFTVNFSSDINILEEN
jgi:hypothetical protein